MKALLDRHRILLVGGPGGVGKTTLAAALGVELARQGHRTVVLTVDPARRLAQALGLKAIGADTQEVDVGNGNKLQASMLDGRRYFDRVIARFARDEQQRDKVLNHPIYQTMVESLGGTQEYAAMERLLEFAEQKEFEKIIVDTPPTHNAAELLSAPGRLADFMDNSVLKWFGPSSEKLSGKLVAKGTQMAIKLLKKILGSEFFDAFGTLVSEFDGMQAGFRQRHLEVLSLLRSPECGFFLVSYPSEIRFLESKAFRETLRSMTIPLRAIVLNRIETAVPRAETTDSEGMRALLEYRSALFAQQQRWKEEFGKLLNDTPLYSVERLAEAPQDVEALRSVGEMLTQSDGLR